MWIISSSSKKDYIPCIVSKARAEVIKEAKEIARKCPINTGSLTKEIKTLFDLY